jgi:hypothetical protein
MNREQARRVLSAYRPDSPNAEDPDITAALELAGNDQELGAWLEDQLRFHRTISAELRQIPVPRGLKERILAERPRVIVPLWRRPEFLLAAACLAVGLVLTTLWFRPSRSEETFAGFRSRMITAAFRVYKMDIVTNNPVAVREFLTSRGAPSDYSLTPRLEATPVLGGAKLSWQGHPVSMVCFKLSQKQTLFMFVLNEADLRDRRRPGRVPEVTPVSGVATASWSRDGKVYFIAAPTDLSDLTRYADHSI